jgi:hypothetical protein
MKITDTYSKQYVGQRALIYVSPDQTTTGKHLVKIVWPLGEDNYPTLKWFDEVQDARECFKAIGEQFKAKGYERTKRTQA